MALVRGGGGKRGKARNPGKRKVGTGSTKQRDAGAGIAAVNRRNRGGGSSSGRASGGSSGGGGGGGFSSFPTPVSQPTPTTSTPRPSVPSAPVIDREAIRQQVANTLDPYYNQARDRVRSQLVDQGLFSSTPAAEAIRDRLEAPFAQQRAALASELERRVTQDELSRQTGLAEMARRWYETLAAEGLQRYGLTGGPTLTSPVLPDAASFFENFAFAPPSFVEGPVGDNGVDARKWRHRSENVGPTLAARQFEAENDRANAYLDIAQQQAAQEQGATDDFSRMIEDALSNRALGQQAPGSNIFPSALVDILNARFPETDLVAEVKAGNPRAEAVIMSMYRDPENARRLIGRIKSGDPVAEARVRQDAGSGSNVGTGRSIDTDQRDFFFNEQYRPFGPTGSDVASALGRPYERGSNVTRYSTR